jgi:hypothetical protein
MFAALVIAGCAGAEIVAPVDSPVTIETSQLYLTVKNVAGLPLTDLTIGIKPGGVRPEYKKSLRRLASGQEMDIPFQEFQGIDGNPLNLQSVRPRSVHITGTDLNGNAHDVELPWE